MNHPMMTPPMPQRIVSHTGVLSLSPGATHFPRNPMMMPAMITPMISMSSFSLRGTSWISRPLGHRYPTTDVAMPMHQARSAAGTGPWRPRRPKDRCRHNERGQQDRPVIAPDQEPHDLDERDERAHDYQP